MLPAGNQPEHFSNFFLGEIFVFLNTSYISPYIFKTYLSWCHFVPIMHLNTAVLVIGDTQWHLRCKEGPGEKISEDTVVFCQSLYMIWTTRLLPRLLHSVQRDLNWCGWRRLR